jgi:protein-S-isoprenylcysteine O-methyltransferase Ste14
MSAVSSWTATHWAWTVFACYWIVSARNLKRVAQKESLASRVPHILVVVVAYILLLDRRLSLGPLNRRATPPDDWLGWTGVVITCLGVVIAIWARVHIGQYWSGRITLKEDHQLIRSGPYAHVRHPIYTGLLLAATGTAIANGLLRGWLGLLIILLLHFRKARREEALLLSKFGEAYGEYRLHSGFLLPRLR